MSVLPDLPTLRAAVLAIVAPVLPDAAEGFITEAQLENLGESRLARVLPVSVEIDQADRTRGGLWHVVRFAVHFAERVEPEDSAAVDLRIAIMTDLYEAFAAAAAADGVGGFDLTEVAFGGGVGELYDPENLLANRVFLSSVEVLLSIPA